jgi:hypothetical protein
MRTVHEQALDAAKREFCRLRLSGEERLIRTLLGRWVSEIEPSVARDQDLRVIGLSAGGRIVVRSEDL